MTNRTDTIRRIGRAVACVAAVGVFVLLLATHPEWLSAGIAVGLTLAVGIGVALRFIRAPKGRRLRSGLGPAAGAAESYQQLLVGREPTSELIEHAFPAVLDETATSEPPQPRG